MYVSLNFTYVHFEFFRVAPADLGVGPCSNDIPEDIPRDLLTGSRDR